MSLIVRTFRAKDSGGPGFAVEFRVPHPSGFREVRHEGVHREEQKSSGTPRPGQ